MRLRWKLGLATSLVSMVSVAGFASAASSGTSLTCSWHAQNQGPWQTHGTQRGSVKCNRPLGKGAYHARYRDSVKPTRPLTTGQSGSSRLSFQDGTVRGTYRLPPAAYRPKTRFHGTFRITGGTGRFQHASGTLHLVCTVNPPTQSCTASGPAAGV